LSEIPKAIFSADGSAHHQRNAVKKLTQRPHQIWPGRPGALLTDATEDQLHQTLDLLYTLQRLEPRLSHS
jgi:hypothetical protein